MFKESTPHILSYIVMGSLCAGFFLGIVPSEAYAPVRETGASKENKIYGRPI